MTEKNRSPPLAGGTSTEAIEPTILFQKGQVHLYGIKIRYPQHGKDIRHANYAQTECQFRYCGTAIPFLTVRSTAR